MPLRKPAKKSTNTASRIGKARLAAMIEEATVDAYGDSEQTTGWYTMLEEHLALPFETTVLGVVVTTALFHAHPDLPEGQLAKLRASVVNMRALAEVARGLGPYGLGPYLLLGKGEETTGGRDKASILADTLEALLGAIYLQHGLDIAAQANLALA